MGCPKVMLHLNRLGSTQPENSLPLDSRGWIEMWRLPVATSSPGRARTLVHDALVAHGLEALADDFVMCASESVTNAVTYTGRRSKAPIILLLSYDPLTDHVTLTCIDTNGKYGKWAPALQRVDVKFHSELWTGTTIHVGLGIVQNLTGANGGDLEIKRLGSCNIIRAWMKVATAPAAVA